MKFEMDLNHNHKLKENQLNTSIQITQRLNRMNWMRRWNTKLSIALEVKSKRVMIWIYVRTDWNLDSLFAVQLQLDDISCFHLFKSTIQMNENSEIKWNCAHLLLLSIWHLPVDRIDSQFQSDSEVNSKKWTNNHKDRKREKLVNQLVMIR